MAFDEHKKYARISDQPLKWHICHEPLLYRDKYPISFRLIILHAMRRYFKSTPCNAKSSKKLLTELKNATESKTPSYYEPSFMELYIFNKNEEKGLLLIDHSYGCFALVLYPKDNNPEHGFRIGAFIKALEDLLLNHESYDKLLNSRQAWDTQLVDQLRATFTFSKDEDSSEL